MKWLFTIAGAIIALVAGMAFLLFLACSGMVVPLELAIYLTSGWYFHAQRVWPELRWDFESLALAGVYLILFTVGLHSFLRWYSHVWSKARDSQTTPASHWKVCWTLKVTSLVIVLFAAGISLLGIAHQIVWLGRSPVPLVTKYWEGNLRSSSVNKLHHLTSASTRGHESDTLIAGYVVDAGGEPAHGWLTLLLPQLQEQALYDRIDRSKHWDDPANRAAYQTRLEQAVLGHSLGMEAGLLEWDRDGYAVAHYAGNVDLLGSDRAWRREEITDGQSHTILFGEAAGNFRPWGHPHNVRNLRLGMNQSRDGFGGPWADGGGQVVMADGSVQYLSPRTDRKVLEALATPNAGEDPGESWREN